MRVVKGSRVKVTLGKFLLFSNVKAQSEIERTAVHDEEGDEEYNLTQDLVQWIRKDTIDMDEPYFNPRPFQHFGGFLHSIFGSRCEHRAAWVRQDKKLTDERKHRVLLYNLCG